MKTPLIALSFAFLFMSLIFMLNAIHYDLEKINESLSKPCKSNK